MINFYALKLQNIPMNNKRRLQGFDTRARHMWFCRERVSPFSSIYILSNYFVFYRKISIRFILRRFSVDISGLKVKNSFSGGAQ